jgi:hypothetical protein
VAHRNAPLTELGRLRLAQCIVDQGWPQARAAERFQVSRPTAHRWATRYRALGPAGMTDRSSRPRHSPSQTPAPVVRQIVHLRWKQRLGPAQIAPRVGRAPSTVHRVLVRCRISQLSASSPTSTGQPARPSVARPSVTRSTAMSTRSRVRCCMSTSRSSATSPPVAATGCSAGRQANGRRTQLQRRPQQRQDQPPPQPAARSRLYPRRRR